MQKKLLYQTRFIHQNHSFTLYKTNQGLALITTTIDQSNQFHVSWLKKTFTNYQIIEDEQMFKLEIKQLKEYFAGQLTKFTIPIDLYGTTFQKIVWHALQDIPYGTTISYSELAAAINRPTAVRAVSRAIGQNPLLILIPCHRVIGKNKKLTGFRAGLPLKQALIDLEFNHR